MDNSRDLRVLIASRHPLIVAEVTDETRFLSILRRAAETVGVPVWTWSVTKGLTRDGTDNKQYMTADCKKALDFVSEIAGPAVFVFADAQHVVEDPVVVRRMKELAQEGKPGRTIVLTSPGKTLPEELKGLALPWTLSAPTKEEIEEMVRRTLDELSVRGIPVSLDAAGIAGLVEALRGLTIQEAAQLIQEAAFEDQAVTDADVEFIRKAKAELLESDGVLELVESTAGTLENVGGLENLKDWLGLRGRAFGEGAEEFGLDPPRGVLLTGVPGCGKSLVAKTLAHTWHLPLILLDPARLYGPYVGQSEQRLRDCLKTVEAMAPVVLWIDEIEKGLAAESMGDSGVSQRLRGTFLRWMQDRPPGVFLIATCNEVDLLPPEFLRKGRFDEIFFVDLPDEKERGEIFRLHLVRRKRDPNLFDIAALSAASDSFSGAEIEAAVVGALYRAFADSRELTTDDLLRELSATVPLSKSKAEDIARLREWAAERTIAA
ncbi:MAG: AAA family ATPase [Actinomycetota bacterium]